MKGPLCKLKWSSAKNKTTGLEELFVQLCGRSKGKSEGSRLRFYPDEWLSDYSTAGWDSLFGLQIVSYTKSGIEAPFMLVLEKVTKREQVFQRVSLALTSSEANIISDSLFGMKVVISII